MPLPHGRELVVIAAVARNRAIGIDNRLPWRLPADLRRFRALTTGHAIVMGRKTFESIGQPLPDRQNIVVSRRASALTGCTMAPSLEAALAAVDRPDPVFCIGGAELYRAALPLASRLELTEVDADVEGDAFFPRVERDDWVEVARESHRDDSEGYGYDFVSYARRRP